MIYLTWFRFSLENSSEFQKMLLILLQMAQKESKSSFSRFLFLAQYTSKGILLAIFSQYLTDIFILLSSKLSIYLNSTTFVHQFERKFTIFTLKSWRVILIFTIPAEFFLLEISIWLGGHVGGCSFHIISSHSRHFFLLILLFFEIIFLVFVVGESHGTEITIVEAHLVHIVHGVRIPLFMNFLAGVGFQMLHDLGQNLFFDFITILWRQIQTLDQFFSKIRRGYFIFRKIPIKLVLYDSIFINGNVNIN